MAGHMRKWARAPWRYNDPDTFTQGHGKFSETAVYATGNAFPWRMAEISGPDKETEVSTAHLIAAAPELYEACMAFLRAQSAPRDNDTEIALWDAAIEAIDAAVAKAEGR